MIESPLIKFKKRGRERYEACDDEDGEMSKQEELRSDSSEQGDHCLRGGRCPEGAGVGDIQSELSDPKLLTANC